MLTQPLLRFLHQIDRPRTAAGPHEKRGDTSPPHPATTVVPVSGALYDPAVMDYQLPDLCRSDMPTAWLTRARTSGGCHHGSFGRWPAAPADSADDDHQITNLLKKLGKKADALEHEALTAMRSAPFERPERGRVAVKIVAATEIEMTTVTTGAPLDIGEKSVGVEE